MLHKKTTLSLLLLVSVCITSLFAQEGISVSGGDASGDGGSVSYTIGQIVYTTNVGSNGSVGQGVQQPFEISVVSAVEEAKDIFLQFSAYPNPAKDFLILTIGGENSSQYKAYLYDINGKILSVEDIVSLETRIDMRNLLPAIYFLKIVETLGIATPSQSAYQIPTTAQGIKTFKIIKN